MRPATTFLLFNCQMPELFEDEEFYCESFGFVV